MTFWLLAALILLAAALITCWPLMRGSPGWKIVATALLVLVPVGSLLLYNDVGTPQALEITPVSMADTEIESMTDSLRDRLAQTPDDLDGWMLLGRTYKAMQQFPEALEAMETAYRLAPDNPRVLIELVEAQLFASGNPRFSDAMIVDLRKAVAMDPSQQKGLWLLGVASAQGGDDNAAIEYWQRLAAQLEPDSPVSDSVQDQITQAQARLGVEPSPVPAADGWLGIQLQITAQDSLLEGAAGLPPGAALFVIVYPPGPRAGPPLGVRRISGPIFPLELTLRDADSMMPERLISDQQQVQLQARLSLSGQAQASSGDWQSAAVDIAVDSGEAVVLKLDQQIN
jgi:cytochrome c-type biogenesis protein CcmH